MRRFGNLLSLVLLLVLLAGCGGSAYTQTADGDHYRAELTLDGMGTGRRSAEIALFDKAGQPADADLLVLLPVMRDMGMASPEISATRSGPGHYQASGEFFSMAGAWEIDLRIKGAKGEETLRFNVTASAS